MITTRIQAAESCTQLSAVAERLIEQFNELPPQQSEVMHFYKGVAVRTGVHLKDAGMILYTNRDEHINTALSIFRIVLDDMLRSCFVYASTDRQVALDKITAKAHKDWFATWKEAARLNRLLNLGGDMTTEIVEACRQKFVSKEANARYVKRDKHEQLVIRDDFNSRTMVDAIEKCSRVAQYVRSYVLFKQMSHYIHYSMRTYEMDRSPSRVIEINFADEVLFLAYHLLRLTHEVLAEANPRLAWPSGSLDTMFNRPGYIVLSNSEDANSA